MGNDSLEHYACCPAAHRYLERRVPVVFGDASISNFLLLDSEIDDSMIFRAVHVYAVYGSVNHVRAGQLPHGSFDLDMLLWERWRAAMNQKHSLFRRLNEQWHGRSSSLQGRSHIQQASSRAPTSCKLVLNAGYYQFA